MLHKKRSLKKIDDEYWKEIPNCDRPYLISNYGRIKSFIYDKKNGTLLKGSETHGFKQATLAVKKVRRTFYVHKLVAEIWLPKPSDKHTIVIHLDGNLKNNHVSNLEWHTKKSWKKKHREQLKQKYNNSITKLQPRSSKLKVSDVMHLKRMLQRGVSQAMIAKLFCISEMQVTRIKRGENWAWVQPANIEENEV